MNSGEIEDLKRRIGEVAGGKAYNPKHAYTKSLEELIEDLKVYQYELEFQNEELKRIQNDLELSREEYLQLFENAPVCYVIIDNNFRILKRNKLFNSHFGEFLHEKEQLDFRSLLEAASQDVFYFFCQELFTTGIAHPVEVNMRSSDGKICCMQIEANASVGAPEVVYRMSLNDLAENKTLYTAIVASEKEKRMITDNVNDMVVISDSSGIISYVSPSIKQFGFLPADYIGKTLFDFVHPDDAQMAMQAFNEGVGAKGKNAIIFRTPVKNGGYLWVETSGTVVLDEEQQVIQAVFVVRNIEDRKKAEDELKYANELLSQVGVMARIGAWELRAEDNLLFWSPVTRAILGVDASYVPNLSETFLFFPIGDIRQSIICSLEKALTKGVEFDLEARINTVDRGLIWVRIKGIPIFENGKVVKLRGLFQDINEIKQAELLLKDYAHELHESNMAKDKLFSIIAHDLRSPFNAFLNLTEILNQEFNSFSDEEIKKLTETIYSSALNINVLINNLLEWSRLQRGRLVPQASTVLVKDLVQKAIESVRLQLDGKSIKVKVLIDETFIARLDAEMTATVLRNLLSNACKFTHREGEITISLIKNENHFSLDVADSGIGIPEKMQNELFEISGSKGRRGTEGEKSSGLGLMLCKELTELQGGSIRLRETSSQGSCFRITMPLNV